MFTKVRNLIILTKDHTYFSLSYISIMRNNVIIVAITQSCSSEQSVWLASLNYLLTYITRAILLDSSKVQINLKKLFRKTARGPVLFWLGKFPNWILAWSHVMNSCSILTLERPKTLDHEHNIETTTRNMKCVIIWTEKSPLGDIENLPSAHADY